MQSTLKFISDFEQREKDSRAKDLKAEGQIADLQRKIEKTRGEVEQNEQEVEKKREKLRAIEHDIRSYESGAAQAMEDPTVKMQSEI